MKILGVDISSRSTGASLIEDDKLLEYTKINPIGSMSNSAKMYLFSVELDKILEKWQPDYIAIEDVIQVSSVSITKILARFNGIALISAYKFNKKEPKLFIPSEWKKTIGLSGSVRKCETQLFICKKYNLLKEDKINYYEQKINECSEIDKDSLNSKQKDIDLLKKRMRKEKTIIEELKNQIEELKKEVFTIKKNNKLSISKKFDNLSMELYIDTGINEDIADSVGVALAYQKELIK
ncbi:MAG: crossover junction endodeoxyribonuclease RuvC [Candidatus Nanoarchaeia archaeon]|jgi:Holliday junction resolvasome RuvABC endonuclease subunit|nr:crossover junction endodeoxyribonuclease RuvC [Candidatus Nanoarchaeia archaeon]